MSWRIILSEADCKEQLERIDRAVNPIDNETTRNYLTRALQKFFKENRTMGALKQTVRLLSQNLGPISSAIYSAANLYVRSYNNINHDMRTNGEFYLLDQLSRLQTGTIFDVGANIGDYTNACLERFKGAQIHAFEIVPETHSKLVANVKSSRVITNDFGLSDRSELLDINYNANKNGLSSLVPGTEINKGDWIRRPVRVEKGDNYCSINNIHSIDFLKMDVEGAENLVLAGLSDMLENKKISVIQFEYGMINIYSKFLLIDFWKLLSGYGFALGPLMPRGVAFKDYNARDESFQGPPNYVAVLSSKPAIIEAVKIK